MEKSICIILPTLNEEEAIGKVIDEIPLESLKKEGYQVEVLVVDGGSTDRTVKIAESKGARVLIEKRRGKGRGMRTALEMVKADFIFMFDADFTYPATYIPEMLAMLCLGAPVVLGSRLKGERDKGAISPLNVVGNRLLTWLANILYRTKISDLCTGYWGLKGEIVQDLKLTANGFQFEAELFSELSKKGYAIAEVPIYYRRREGKAKLSSLKDGLKIAWMLILKRFK